MKNHTLFGPQRHRVYSTPLVPVTISVIICIIIVSFNGIQPIIMGVTHRCQHVWGLLSVTCTV